MVNEQELELEEGEIIMHQIDVNGAEQGDSEDDSYVVNPIVATKNQTAERRNMLFCPVKFQDSDKTWWSMIDTIKYFLAQVSRTEYISSMIYILTRTSLWDSIYNRYDIKNFLAQASRTIYISAMI